MADVTSSTAAVPPPNGDILAEKANPTDSPSVTPQLSRPESFHSAASTASQRESLKDTPASSAKTTEAGAKSDEEEEPFELPTNGPLKVPIPRPQTRPPPTPKLTGEQESKYAQVLARVSTWASIPTTTAKTAPSAPLTDDERMWLTRECLLRYLRATKWNTAAALKRLQSTLSWRREYGADKFTFDYISPENETGKQVILGYDNDARPCLYLNPAKQNTDMSDRQIHHLCFMLDRTVDMMPPGQEKACLLINFKGAGSGKVPSVAQARAVLNILQNHNPERLGRALISDLPWFVNTFFKLISPFIDPVTKEKMRFNPNMREHIPPNQLWNHHDGDLNFEYDHKVYWPALQKLTERRKERMRERWVAGGKMIGESEEYLKGGDHLSLKQEIESYGGSAQVSAAASAAASQVDVVAGGVEKMAVR